MSDSYQKKSLAVKAADFFERLSLGAWIILFIAIVSTCIVFLWPIPKKTGQEFWTFAPNHTEAYQPIVEAWNEQQSQDPKKMRILTLSGDALERRLLSGFQADTPLADLIEVDDKKASRCFKGPLEDVGFVDLTERVKTEAFDPNDPSAGSIYENINPASFSPWTNRERIFGLPHDVHPCLLAYRADLCKEAGIGEREINSIETWDDFVRVMKPLVRDPEGGDSGRYVLNFWKGNGDLIEPLMLQAGGGFFSPEGKNTIDSEINTRVLATLCTWIAGPNRIARDADPLQDWGVKMYLRGEAIAFITPDWLAGIFPSKAPSLKGKIKFMKLPAWERGGRRTTVWGGTMLGIPRATKDFENAWKFARNLYLSKDLAEKLFRSSSIISPVKKYWTESFYHEPKPFYSDQPVGSLYIDVAPEVPIRSSSPYNDLSRLRVMSAMTSLYEYALKNKKYTVEELLPEAKRQLEKAKKIVEKQINRNVFLSEKKS